MSKKVTLILLTISFVIILLTIFFSLQQKKKILTESQKNYSDHTVVNFGYFVGSQSIPILIAQKNNLFKEAGVNVNLIDLGRNRGQEVPFLVSGSLDCVNSTKYHIIKAVDSGISLKILTSLAQRQGKAVQMPIAKVSSGIKTFADVRGKTFGYQPGGSNNFLVEKLLDKYGLSTSDINVINLANPEAMAAFQADKIDIFIADILTTAEINQKYPVVVLADSQEIIPNSYSDTIVCRTDFINQHPKIIKKLLETVHSCSFFINEHQTETKAILKKLKVSPSWQNIEFPLYAETSIYASDGIQELSEWLLSKRIIKDTVNPNRLIYSSPK